jgi:3-oxoacyl-[acyl-carrier-protein] synthase II
MVAGGCEADLDFMGFIGFILIKAMAERYKSPETASRPFDRKRNGFVMSEGAGIVVLEELEHARARGAPILGELLGYGDSSDAYRITDPHPEGEGAVLAMRAALQDAALAPDAVDYINAHGTSTPRNDATETAAIKRVFGARAKTIPVSSNKSMLGHTIAAAGAIECILTLVGMQRSMILPTINYAAPDPKCDLDYVPNAARRQAHRIALSNSFGFGGQNACLCLGQFDAERVSAKPVY